MKSKETFAKDLLEGYAPVAERPEVQKARAAALNAAEQYRTAAARLDQLKLAQGDIEARVKLLAGPAALGMGDPAALADAQAQRRIAAADIGAAEEFTAQLARDAEAAAAHVKDAEAAARLEMREPFHTAQRDAVSALNAALDAALAAHERMRRLWETSERLGVGVVAPLAPIEFLSIGRRYPGAQVSLANWRALQRQWKLLP